MAITTRAALKAQFKTGAVPAAKDYFNLIDSMLVKRDDIFFGRWQPGISYHESDVVIYNNALYSCILNADDPCGCGDNGKKEGDSVLDPQGAYCSVLPPNEDTVHWRLLELEISDEDWAIIRAGEEGGMDIMYAQVFGKIGMGTEAPVARVHIHDDNTGGDFLFAPDNATAPAFEIRRSGEGDAQWLSENIDDNKANFITNTEGFLFRQAVVTPLPEGPSEQIADDAPQENASSPVFITAPEGKAAVGIGTVQPEAAVDVQSNDSARLLLNPLHTQVPQLVWLNKGAYGVQQCLAIQVDADVAQLATNAKDGFYFRKSTAECKDYLQGNEAAGETIVSIKPENKVGIGTENPRTHLEATDGKSGSILMSLEKVNPAFCVINLRPKGGKSNYLTIGADKDLGVLVTDSSGGFVFRRGGEYGVSDNEININQGEDLVTIKADGRVGVGIDPEKYELDLFGNARMFTLYLDTDVKKVKDAKPLSSVLAQIKVLNPVRFRWNGKRTSCPDNEEQIGFLPHEVEEVFPELVKTNADKSKTLAYPNMVAILTKALQEQQDQIKALETRLARLEGGAGNQVAR